VAGVQLASRQQYSLVPFFQVRPFALTQLSTDWADAVTAGPASAAAAKSDATVFNFFMVLLSREVFLSKTSEQGSEVAGKPPRTGC
jgi:hypothetical protein